MPKTLRIGKTSKAVKEYYTGIREQYDAGQKHEGAVSPVFADLLEYCAGKVGWRFTQQYLLRLQNRTQRPDGAFTNEFSILEGIWEAKDDDDTLENEVNDKFDAGYPRFNIIFWQPKRIIIYQNGRKVFDEEIAENRGSLVQALKVFFEFEPPHIEQWEKAIEEFSVRLPELSAGLKEKVDQAHQVNDNFKREFAIFRKVCRESINPNISDDAIEEMLIQHMLTRTILSKVFNIPGFFDRNAIAKQLETLRQSLSSRYFSEQAFLGKLQHFYRAIISTASDITDFSKKQEFLNSVFERFFQGWAIKSADRLGIVYTPQQVVDFMVRSVDGILKREFERDKGLASEGVHIIDPFVGTGNFIMRVIEQIGRDDLPYKYSNELHCNEIQLMPYYIASMNIEHEYWEKMNT